MPDIDLTQIKLTLVLEENKPPKVEIESGGLTGSFPFPLTGDSFVVRPSASVSIALALKGIYTDTNGDGLPDHGGAGGGGGSTPEWLPDGAISHVELSSTQARAWTVGSGVVGVETLLGSEASTGDAWGQATAYDPADLTADGLVPGAVAVIGAAKTQLLAGATAVMRIKNADAVTYFAFVAENGSNALEIDLNGSEGGSVEASSWNGSLSVIVPGEMTVPGVNQVAFTVTTTHAALSCNGATAVAGDVTGDDFPSGPSVVLIDLSTGILQSLTIYPPRPDADLPALSALPEAETPEWLPDGAVAFADFVNSHYYAGNGEADATTLLSGDFGLDAVTPGQGILCPADGSFFKFWFEGDLLAATVADSGSTVVIEYVPFDPFPNFEESLAFQIEEGRESPPTRFFFSSYNNYTDFYYTTSGDDPNLTFGGAYGAQTGGVPNRVAVTMSGTTADISFNGEAVHHNVVTPSDTYNFATRATAASVAIVPGMILRSITIYPPQSDADLPALSAL